MSESITRNVVVTNPEGIHARAAVAIAETVRRGKSRVTMAKEQRRIEATDVLQLLTMAAAQGERIEVEADGARRRRSAGRPRAAVCRPVWRRSQEIRISVDAKTTRDCRLARRGHRRGAGDGHRGIPHPSPFRGADAVVDELERLDKAISAAAAEIAHHRETVSAELGEKYGAIFEAHLQMLQDSRLRSELEEMIRQRHYSPEYAVSRILRRYAQVFQRLETSYLAERANDIFDIEKRLLRHLLGRRREGISNLASPVLVLAHNLTPSETANLDRRFVRGFVTEIGGPGSHTAIVAEALEIPAVVGTGPFLTEVSGGELAIIDGDKGLVILQPDEETLASYRHEAEETRIQASKLEPLRDLPAETLDGVRIELLGNIEFPYEVDHCVDRGADGVGLYRTEFLYLGAEIEPTEEVHFQAYSRVVQAMGQKPVVIRTFDLGADKMPNMARPDDERNPCLGLRSIRLALRNLPLFRTQLRAALRATALGNVHIMFPLVSTLLELRQAKMVLADVMEDLQEHNIPFNRNVPVGMMVETPAAAMMIDQLRRGGRFSQHRHERSGAIHAGRRSEQQGRGGIVQSGRSGGIEADRHVDRGRRPQRRADQHVRADERQPVVHDAAVGNGLAEIQRKPQFHSRGEESLPQRVAGRMPGRRRPGKDAGKRPGREKLSEGRSEETRSRDCRVAVRGRRRLCFSITNPPNVMLKHNLRTIAQPTKGSHAERGNQNLIQENKQIFWFPADNGSGGRSRTDGSITSTRSFFQAGRPAADRAPRPDAVPGAIVPPSRAGAELQRGVPSETTDDVSPGPGGRNRGR